jgi:hypothetical protein
VGKITDIRQLRLEILRRKTLAAHQEESLRQDWSELKASAWKFNYAARVVSFFSGFSSGKASNPFVNFIYRSIDKAAAAKIFRKLPFLFRKIPEAFAKAGIPDMKEKISGLWKQFSGFWGKD